MVGENRPFRICLAEGLTSESVTLEVILPLMISMQLFQSKYIA